MSKWDEYQHFSTEAAKHGGANAYISELEQAAFLKGAGIMLAVAGGVAFVTGKAKERRARKAMKEQGHG